MRVRLDRLKRILCFPYMDQYYSHLYICFTCVSDLQNVISETLSHLLCVSMSTFSLLRMEECGNDNENHHINDGSYTSDALFMVWCSFFEPLI